MRWAEEKSLSEKIDRILKVIFCVLLLFTARIWYLAIPCHEKKLQEARTPQYKTFFEKAERATICDRFDIPLASNRVVYQAGVSYAPIRKVARSERKEYITKFSQMLGQILFLDPERIEDLIYAKAANMGAVPLILKEGISEEVYFTLSMLEKDFPGLYTAVATKRYYPFGKMAGDVIGYVGPISQKEYKESLEEIKKLKERQEEEGIDLSYEIEKKTRAFNDYKGKTGIEAAFDEELRGKNGKKVYQIDKRGGLIRKLESSEEPEEGQRVKLSLTAELQEYAETLLASYNAEPPTTIPSQVKRRELAPDSQPWIKEGAIVAMHPFTGEILALASYPRFDPNDFIKSDDEEEEKKRRMRVHHWIEDESYLGHIWNEKYPLTREKFEGRKGGSYEEKCTLHWSTFLHFILPTKSPLFQILEKKNSLADALLVQGEVEKLLELFRDEEHPLSLAQIFDQIYATQDVKSEEIITLAQKKVLSEKAILYEEKIAKIAEKLAPYFAKVPFNEEKLILVDLYRLAVDSSRFTPSLAELFGGQTIEEFKDLSVSMVQVADAVKEIIQPLFHKCDFQQWREKHFKKFLKEKRREEIAAGLRYGRPYIEYLDEKERSLFKEFWEKNKELFIAQFLVEYAKEDTPYIHHVNTWRKELCSGKHLAVQWRDSYVKLQKWAEEIHPSILLSYLHTLRGFDDLVRPLYGHYPGLRKLGGRYIEKSLAMGFYPKCGYGYLRSHAFRQDTVIGSLFKLVPAYEALRQRYLKYGPGKDLNPLTIIDDKNYQPGRGWIVGRTLEGKTIPLFYKGGRLPRSEHARVGKVDLIRALGASSNPYFSLLAGDIFEDPEDLAAASRLFGFGEKTGIDLPGEYAGQIPEDITYNRSGLYSMAIGQHSLLATPLQGALLLSAIVNGGKILKPQILYGQEAEVRWQVFMPKEIASILVQGMREVVVGEKGTAREAKKSFSADLIERVMGKTSTAEVMKCYGVDQTSRSLKRKEIWFGALVADEQNTPEIVIVVYLKEGEFGRLSVPLALKMAEKWHAIRLKNKA